MSIKKSISRVDRGIERFLDEIGFYTNKSEFIKGVCRSRLRDVNSDAVVAARRAEQLLVNAERTPEKQKRSKLVSRNSVRTSIPTSLPTR